MPLHLVEFGLIGGLVTAGILLHGKTVNEGDKALYVLPTTSATSQAAGASYTGVFKKGADYYLADGASYCAYPDWNTYLSMTASDGTQTVPDGGDLTDHLKDRGVCKPAAKALSPIAAGNLRFSKHAGAIVREAEFTPWVVWDGYGWPALTVSTSITWLCARPNKLFDAAVGESVDSNGGFCGLRLLPQYLDPSAKANQVWKHTYNGTMSAQLLPGSTWTLYTINHGESVAIDRSTDHVCNSTPDFGYGAFSCEGADGYGKWESYNAFVTMSSTPWTLENLKNPRLFTDYGPIAWPANGYVEYDGSQSKYIKATDGGIRCPFSFLWDGYLYVYYDDLSQGDSSKGRGPGIKVVRAPVVNGTVDPHSFRAYYKEAGGFVDSALPNGFNADNAYQYMKSPGGRSTKLFGKLATFSPAEQLRPHTGRKGTLKISTILSFQVAKIKGEDLFVGVAFELDSGVTLRFSRDLIHWSKPWMIPGTYTNWLVSGFDAAAKGIFLYPILLNTSQTSNQEIDASHFYVTGNQVRSLPEGGTGHVVNHISLQLDIVESAKLADDALKY